MKTLTFAKTLHPEYAQVHLDVQDGERHWGTIYNEARADIPTAVALRVEEDEEQGTKEDVYQSSESSVVVTQSDTPQGNQESVGDRPNPYGRGCCYLEGLLGYTIVLCAVVSTFAIELSAAIIYTVASCFYFITNVGDIGILFKAIFLLVVHLLMVVDGLLLTISVMITEILGATSCLVTIFFVQSCRSSRDWHLHIRKTCHLTRWTFRGFHEGWALERHFPVDVIDKDAAETNAVTTGQNSASTTTSASQQTQQQQLSADPEEPAQQQDDTVDNIVIVDHLTYEDEKK
jgi:hypothetical protein